MQIPQQRSGWEAFLDVFRERDKRSQIRKHLSLIPYDVLVILFIGQSMLPWWAALLLAVVNFGTWWCYHRIPQFLRTVSGSQGESILIPGPIVEYFASFISSCGIHHRAHYGLMLAMMAGFHAAMTGTLWDMALPMASALLIGWTCFGLLLLIDTIMFWVSLRTLQELKKDKLREGNAYAAELKRSNEDLEKFAYIASHDLRSPLNAMGNLTDWITQDLEEGNYTEKTQKYLHVLRGRISRLDRLLNDLLQYSRIGHEEAELDYVSLLQKVRDVFGALDVEGTQVLTLTGDDLWVYDYDVTYEILIGNLIGNAFKHNDKDCTQIDVHIENNQRGVFLKVGDNGPGISDRDQEKVFDVFSTLQRRDAVEASGMGLALVKKIVTHKNGYVGISKSPLGGAEFNIFLPIETFTALDVEDRKTRHSKAA